MLHPGPMTDTGHHGFAGGGFPYGRTARRRTWDQLPGHVHTTVEQNVGSPVESARSMTSGFTPGFASVLTLADGRRAFVKAAGKDDDERQGWSITGSYREEARKRLALPDELPAPRLLWSSDDGDWIVTGFEYVAGRLPRRPWDPAELRRVLDTVTAMAPLLDQPPDGLDLETVAQFFATLPARGETVLARDGASPTLTALAKLAAEFPDRCAGKSVQQFDLRDDNILLADDGRVWICDWNWPLLGAPWLDLVGLLLSVHGDGLEADAIVTSHPLTAEVDPRSIDAFLAGLWLYFTTAGDQPVPTASPYIRDFQKLQAGWTLSWLRKRGALP